MAGFEINPVISVGLIGLTVLYFMAIGPWRVRYTLGPAVPKQQRIFFTAAMLLLFFSLQGPIQTYGEQYLFSVHMTQHILIATLMPLLLLKGVPAWLVDLPLSIPIVDRLARFLTHWAIAFALFNIAFVIWHVPAFYDAAVANPVIHAFEHLTFMVPGVLTWWPVFSPTLRLPRLNEPVQLVYLFFQSIPTTILGALLTFATFVIYPAYAVAPRLVGVDPLMDQQAAGLIMWFGGATIILGVMTQRFMRWMGNDEDDGAERVRT